MHNHKHSNMHQQFKMHNHKNLQGNSITHRLCRINASLKSVVSTFSNKTPLNNTDIMIAFATLML